jgi:hypothetical protein
LHIHVFGNRPGGSPLKVMLGRDSKARIAGCQRGSTTSAIVVETSGIIRSRQVPR